MNGMGMHFEDEGKITSLTGNISLARAAALGAACAKTAENNRVIVAHSDSGGAQALAFAFASGVSSAGGKCFFAGSCAMPAACCADQLDCDIGCYAYTDVSAGFMLFGKDGLPLHRNTEEMILSYIDNTEIIPYSHFGETEIFMGAESLYLGRLKKLLTHIPEKVYGDFYSPSSKITELCEKAAEGMNEKKGSRIAFHISSDGRSACAYSEETGYVFHDKLLLICYKDLFERGEAAAVCGKMPMGLEKTAKKFGGRIISCGRNYCSHEKTEEKCLNARKAASSQLFAYDGAALSLTVLDILAKRNIGLADAVNELPSYAGVTRYIPVKEPSEYLRSICSDGVAENSGRGMVTIRPVRTGKGIMLSVESYSMEAASELCDLYAADIRNGCVNGKIGK